MKFMAHTYFECGFPKKTFLDPGFHTHQIQDGFKILLNKFTYFKLQGQICVLGLPTQAIISLGIHC